MICRKDSHAEVIYRGLGEAYLWNEARQCFLPSVDLTDDLDLPPGLAVDQLFSLEPSPVQLTLSEREGVVFILKLAQNGKIEGVGDSAWLRSALEKLAAS